jgi:Mg2+ and Co2+ transporter CorA
MAFITFPLSVFVGLIAIHTPYNPIIGKPYDFEIILGTIIVAVIAMLGFFKYKKWL